MTGRAPGGRRVRPLLLHFESRSAWRSWLAENHASARELWLVFFKVHTGRPCVAYEDAVEEALCFGWIDSIVKRLDDERYARKFTPRNAGSGWSDSNRRRVAKVVREGRMTPAGMAVVDFAVPPRGGAEATGGARVREEPRLAPELLRRLEANARAWATFRALAPSYRRNYVGWIMSAKREETRLRRLEEAIGLLAEGKKLGLK